MCYTGWWPLRISAFISFLVITLSFTRKHRTAEVQYELSSGGHVLIQIDPFVMSLDELAAEVCNQLVCPEDITLLQDELGSHLLQITMARTEQHYQSYMESLLPINEENVREVRWLQFASESLDRKTLNHLKEVRDLAKGSIVPRVHCTYNDEGKKKEYSHNCALDYLSSELIFPDASASNGFVTLHQYLILGETLFNHGNPNTFMA